jgi:hypothetical protein
LPDSSTGAYFAAGALVGSTLKGAGAKYTVDPRTGKHKNLGTFPTL